MIARLLKGLTLAITGIAFFYSIAFTALTYINDVRQIPEVYRDMLEEGEGIASLYRTDAAGFDRSLEQLARMTGWRFVLADDAGGIRQYGQHADRLAHGVSGEELRQVLDGATLRQYERSWIGEGGRARTGQHLQTEGRPTALFIERDTAPILGSLGSYLITVFSGFLLFGLSMSLLAHPFRKRQFTNMSNILDAMRRMAKGDFNITLSADTRRMGPFGEIAHSLNDMASELHETERMRQEFISNVSHEIQSPLTSIQGFARALQDDGLSHGDRNRYLGIIETESGRLSKISENLLKLTSLESKHHPFEPKRYRLDKQLRKILLACEPQWLNKAIQMDVFLEEVYITADEDLLSQLWINLIGNSIKFTPEGGTIGVRLSQHEDRTIVRLTDTGIGMSADELPRIFERFYKADKSRNQREGGSGLGLSIVRKIVDMHGGAIEVQSEPGEGSVFTVTLPTKAYYSL